MNLIINGKQLELTNKIKNYANEKCKIRFHGLESRIHNIRIVIGPEKNSYKCDCDLTSDFGEFFASSLEENLYTAIDNALHRAASELKKKHDKSVNHRPYAQSVSDLN